ncbi:hypothetical protein C8R45DRAFT_1068700 [Mycena sanguinolenta]|nr:hypothetical protein C8R45DRAFT_1068700 [Mycena sanguinolenta]
MATSATNATRYWAIPLCNRIVTSLSKHMQHTTTLRLQSWEMSFMRISREKPDLPFGANWQIVHNYPINKNDYRLRHGKDRNDSDHGQDKDALATQNGTTVVVLMCCMDGTIKCDLRAVRRTVDRDVVFEGVRSDGQTQMAKDSGWDHAAESVECTKEMFADHQVCDMNLNGFYTSLAMISGHYCVLKFIELHGMCKGTQSKSKLKSRKDSDRVSKPSARQRASDENKTNDAAKTAANKQRTRDAAARKNKCAANDAEAATLQNVTTTAIAGAFCRGADCCSNCCVIVLSTRVALTQSQRNSIQPIQRNELLKKIIRRAQPDSTAENTDITPIPKPKGKFNVQPTMGLDNDCARFTEIQTVIRVIAVEAKIDFTAPWSQQDPSTVAKVLLPNGIAISAPSGSPVIGQHQHFYSVTSTAEGQPHKRVDMDDAAGACGSASPEPQDKQSPDSAPLIDGSDDDDEDNSGGGSQLELDDEDSEEEEEELPVAAD